MPATAERVVLGTGLRFYFAALMAVPVLFSAAAISLLTASAFGVNPLWGVGEPTVIDAIRIGDFDGLQQMLAAGRDPWSRRPFRHPALFDGKRVTIAPFAAAAALGDARMVDALLAAGAERPPAELGEALCAGARHGRTDAVALLLKAGAPVNGGCGAEHRTPLRLAVDAGHGSVIGLLREAGGHDGRTLMEIILSGNREGVREKLAEGADPNRVESFVHPDLFGGTPKRLRPIVAAASLGENQMIDALVEAGATVRGPDGGSALCAAVRYGRPDAAVVLLDAGAPVNVTCDDGRSPLQVAYEGGHGSIADRIRLVAGGDGGFGK